MQTIKPDFPKLPDGFIPVKIGGRPKREARDAAVFLAKFWRMETAGENAATAEKWIVNSWEELGINASKGISETAHVRAAIKRARNRGLNQSLLMIMQPGGVCTAVQGEKTDGVPSVTDGARSWHWVKGMPEALEGQVKNPRTTVHQEVMHLSPIFAAVRAMTRAIS